MLGVILFAVRWGVLVCCESSRLCRGRWVALGGAGCIGRARAGVEGLDWVGYMVAAGRAILGQKSRRRTILL